MSTDNKNGKGSGCCSAEAPKSTSQSSTACCGGDKSDQGKKDTSKGSCCGN